MGKASKWFRAIFGLKPTNPEKKTKGRSYGKKPKQNSNDVPRKSTPNVRNDDDDEASKHAIAVAAATAAVAEAAVAAAQAAAAVVKLTSGGANVSRQIPAHASRGGAGYRGENVSREEWAAVIVQSHFRAYLARKALRALKGLVKIQALVRGHLVRKQTAYALRRLQALIRAQDRARSGRVMMSESPHSTKKSSHFNYAGPATPEKSEHVVRARNTCKIENYASTKINGSKTNHGSNYDSEKSHTSQTRTDNCRKNSRTWEQGSLTKTLSTDDDRSDKILEVDTISQHIVPKRKSIFHSSHLSISSDQNCQSFSTSKDTIAHQSVLSPSSCEVQSSFHFAPDVDESAFYTADNSPQFYSSSSMGGDSCRRETFTPTRSCLSSYSDYPNYMVCTESSKAKVRSLSAPRQRASYERSSSTKRYSVHGSYGDSRSNPQRATQNLHANFANKAYPGSGRLDRLGMPVRSDNTRGFSGGLWHRY